MTPEQAAFVLRVLAVCAEHDACGEVWWRTDEAYAPVTFFVNCNDQFFWAVADAEPITPENIGVLEQAYADCVAAGDQFGSHGPALFCSRVRGMRPQGVCYPQEPALWPLFDACGPVRAVDFGNPHKHPADGGEYAYKEPTK